MRNLILLGSLCLLGVAAWLWANPVAQEEPRVAPDEVLEVEQATAQEPRIVRVVPPSSPVRTVIEASGCDESTPPTRGGLGESANLVQSELWDRALAIFRARESSSELRDGLREVFTRTGDVDRGLEQIASAADRVDSGFDHATSAAFTAALRAMGDDRFEDAERWIVWLDAQDPESPLTPLARAVRARYNGDDYAERDGMREALRRDPEQPGVALTLALREMRIGAAADALAALDLYRETTPEQNEWVDATRPRLVRAQELESMMRTIEQDGVSVHYPSRTAPDGSRELSVNDAWRVHGTIVAALEEAAQLFARERRPQLRVVIYASLNDYRSVTCGPQWSGARYDGSLRVPAPLLGGVREQSTLRHESLHAQLAHLAPNAPLWLHEGLAQRFEQERSRGMQRTFELMARERTYVPFPSLEGSFLVIEDDDAARFAYHQSYAMVEAILEQEQDAMARAVNHLRTGGDPSELLGVMNEGGLDGDTLLRWVARQVD